MKWELDDTTSDGIRFLLIGAGSLLLLRLGYVGVSRLNSSAVTELEASIAPFQNGFWLSDARTLVTGGMAIGERMALAVVASVVVAALVALIVYMLVRAIGASNSAVLHASRITLIGTLMWFTYAALMVPVRSYRFADDGITRIQHPAILGELSLPWPAWAETFSSQRVSGFFVGRDSTSQPTDRRYEVSAAIDGHSQTVVERRTAFQNDSIMAADMERLGEALNTAYEH